MLTLEELDRTSTQRDLILDALTLGPKSNLYLNEIAFRYSARIHELRKAGHNIVITSHDRKTGVTVYELK